MTQNRILVICPSRDRPDKAIEAYESWKETRTDLSDFYVAIDEDQVDLYKPVLEKGIPIQYCPKGRRGMADCANYAACYWAKHYDYIMFIGDDHRFRTLNWDRFFKEAMDKQGGWGYVYGNDLLQGAALPTEVMVSSNIINLLGYFIYPKLQHLWIDNYWLALGSSIEKITYLDHVVIEHMHYSVGKSEHDQAYKEVNNNDIISHDQHVFTEWVHNPTGLHDEVRQIKEAMASV